ncbi:MAG: UxaA family hydrolase [Peptococcaceae bacterium]|nr:UxaA family hydrolase [Peptococcaceae bacterium]
MNQIVYLDEKDTVATTTCILEAGSQFTLGDQTITAVEEIPFAHKIAVRPMAKGDQVYKYGEPIGVATSDIAVGQLVHVHNVKSNRGIKQ